MYPLDFDHWNANKIAVIERRYLCFVVGNVCRTDNHKVYISIGSEMRMKIHCYNSLTLL